MVLVMIGIPVHAEHRAKVMNQLHDRGTKENN